MPRDIAESDWKVFSKLHPVAMDRWFQRTTKEMQAMLDVDGTPAQEQFWNVLKFATARRKLAANLFDAPSRSRAILMMGSIAHHNLVTEEELSKFTPEGRQRIQDLLDFARRR